jgi:hypothetical protein
MFREGAIGHNGCYEKYTEWNCAIANCERNDRYHYCIHVMDWHKSFPRDQAPVGIVHPMQDVTQNTALLSRHKSSRFSLSHAGEELEPLPSVMTCKPSSTSFETWPFGSCRLRT